jgi:hypothetical protein
MSTKLSKESIALRSHVLERLAIFFASGTREKPVYTADWLAKDDHFQVIEVATVKVRYTFKRTYFHVQVRSRSPVYSIER